MTESPLPFEKTDNAEPSRNRVKERAKAWFERWITNGPKVETEFLPGALEVSETPPSPIGRAIIWTIMSFVVLGILWASLSQIDVVAIAPGKLAPRGQVKIIQASELAVVREVAVRDGQRVKEGDLLISLDPTTSEADEENLEQRLIRARCELALQTALEEWKPNQPEVDSLPLPKEATPTLHALYLSRFHQEIEVVRNELDKHKNDLEQLMSQSKRLEQTAVKFREVLSIDSELSSILKDLFAKQVSSRFHWLEAEQQRIRTSQELGATVEQLEENRVAQEGARQAVTMTLSKFRSDVLKKKSEVETEISSLEQNLAKAIRRNTLMVLTAPVSGQIQQLMANTLGGVVEEAKPLLIIVPDGTELEAEVSVLNRDIGFIRPGQHVEIKLEAFPFTEFGSIPGIVDYISADAIQDKDGVLLFACKIKLLKDHFMINGEKIMLSSGMIVSGEIILRQRRLISYFLSPLMKYEKESFRER